MTSDKTRPLAIGGSCLGSPTRTRRFTFCHSIDRKNVAASARSSIDVSSMTIVPSRSERFPPHLLKVRLSLSQPFEAKKEWIVDTSTPAIRSEEHTSELQSLMRISYAVFCLKKKLARPTTTTTVH